MLPILEQLIHQTPVCQIQAQQFFVAWSGVMTLAYHSFPAELLQLKQQINHTLHGLKPENPGSLWPKTTLGALKAQRILSLEELSAIAKLIAQLQAPLQACPPLTLQQLSVVMFQNRSLEQRLLQQNYPLAHTVTTSSDLAMQTQWQSHVSQNQAIYCQLNESQLANYHPYVCRDGNREPHYQMPHIESTLISSFSPNNAMQQLIDDFKKEVDHITDSAYYWFNKQSLHITIRALTGQ